MPENARSATLPTMHLVVFLLALGTALRLTRLAVTDTITQPFRNAIAMRYAAASARQSHRSANAWLWLVQLFECPWCIGFWISAAVTAVSLSVSPAPAHLPIWFALPAMSFALSWCVGALAFLEATIEDVHHHLD